MSTRSLPTDARIRLDERNRRVQLLRCGRQIEATVAAAVALAEEHGLEKIWGFVSPMEWVTLSQVGFKREGVLDGYFPDSPGIGVARYLAGHRAKSARLEEEDRIVAQAMAATATPASLPPADYTLRMATFDDCAVISRVMTSVFTSYPTPIDSAEAIAKAMTRDVHFAVAECGGDVVSVSSADVDTAHQVAELTDCATLPAYRGHGLMQGLLQTLEAAMREFRLRSLYTLARATSVGMNIAFARLGYAHRGRFLNNCHIAGGWEDMNLWVKPLAGEGGHHQ